MPERTPLEKLAHLGRGEAGKQFHAESFPFAVVLAHPHRLEASRSGQQLVRHVRMRHLAAIDLTIRTLSPIRSGPGTAQERQRNMPGLPGWHAIAWAAGNLGVRH